MNVSKRDLARAAETGVISAAQVDALWSELERTNEGRPRFDLPHVAYYFGALVVMSAMGWFMTRAWERLGGAGLFAIALAYAASFVLVGHHLWVRKRARVPGGLLFTLAVWMTPLAIYGFERMSGFWIQRNPGSYRVYYEWIEGGWCLMEVATIVAGLVAVWFVRFPFLTFPIAFSAWFTSMDVAPLIYGRPGLTWDDGLRVSLWFGVLLLVISWFVDRFMEEDFAFWGYLFGMFAFWDGLSLLEHRGEISAALYCLVNVVLIGLAVPFDRRVFAVFGAIGVYAYLGHLSYVVFNESVTFPFVLGACGLSIIWLGMLYERYRSRVREALAEALPTGARALLPKRRVST